MIFRNWVLKNFPFLEDDFDALTDYELFCKMVEYMKKSLDKVREYQTQLNEFRTELDTYKNYFDNLDVQEEIDNKLDEMADSGELTDIIAQYLQLAGVLAYNTKSELKNATNIVNGSICKTLGNTTYNDGKGAIYKIRTITSDDTIDDNKILALSISNTLIAEKLNEYCNDITNPIYYGADPTGTVDSSDAINDCIQANLGGAISFTPGKYKVDNSIETPYLVSEQVNINFNGSTLFTDEDLDYVIGIGYYHVTNTMPNDNDYTTETCYAILENFVINAPNSEVGILTHQNYWYPRLDNFSIFNTIIGIKLGTSNSETWSSDASITNGLIQCKSYLNTSTRGIVVNGYDNKFTNLRVYNAYIGIEDNKGANYYNNIHIYLYGHLNDRETADFIATYPNTIAFLNSGVNNSFIDVVFDSYNTGFKSTATNFDGKFNQCQYMTNVPGYDTKIFDFSAGTIQALTIENCTFDANSHSQDGTNYGLILSSSQPIQYLSNYLKLSNNFTQWINDDLLMIDTFKPFSQPFLGGNTFVDGNYYKLGLIPIIMYTSYIFGITGSSNPSKQMVRMWVGSNYSLELNNIGVSGTTLYIGAKLVEIKGVKYAEISLKTPNLDSNFGLFLEVNKSKDSIGVVPIVERHVTNANPQNYTTTPDLNTGFEY